MRMPLQLDEFWSDHICLQLLPRLRKCSAFLTYSCFHAIPGIPAYSAVHVTVQTRFGKCPLQHEYTSAHCRSRKAGDRLDIGPVALLSRESIRKSPCMCRPNGPSESDNLIAGAGSRSAAKFSHCLQ